MAQHYRIRMPEAEEESPTRRPALSRRGAVVAGIAVAAILAIPATIILPGHVRLALIDRSEIVIEPMEAPVKAGAEVEIRVFLDGYARGAGVHLSGSGIQETGRVEPIEPGWNSYTRFATGQADWHKVRASLHSASGFDHGDCWFIDRRIENDTWLRTDTPHDRCRSRGAAVTGLSITDEE